MANIHGIDIWQRRWNALNKDMSGRIEDINGRLQDPTCTDTIDDYDRGKLQSVADTLTALQCFAKKYFHFFYNGFNNKNNNMEPTDVYTQEHVWSSILRQIGYDMETLSRIAHDHFSSSGEGTLRKADFLAEEALQLAIGQEWVSSQPQPVVLSYFQKSLTIRVIPYANVLMLGIPYTAEEAHEDLLAVPHEVGHYVFWHGEMDGKPLSQQLMENAPKTPKWCLRWLEEMFADIYGTFVAGPLIALSFQELQFHIRPERFMADDQDHPTPNLRPYMYAKVLKASNSPHSAEALYIRWGQQMGKLPSLPNGRDVHNIYFGNQKPRPIHTAASGEEGAISDGVNLGAEPVDKAVISIIDLFQNWSNSSEWQRIVDSAETFLRDNQLDAAAEQHLYNEFKGFVENKKGRMGQRIVGNCDFEALSAAWKQLKQRDDEPDWLPVWHARGWTTEGPKCVGGSGVLC